MKYIYLFNNNGDCYLVGSGISEDIADEFAERNGAANFMLADNQIDLKKTKLINGILCDVDPIVPNDVILKQIREVRFFKLLASDWTQTLDAPLTPEKKAEWTTYRQALRDFPDTCDPVNPVWPVPPQ